MARKTRKTTLTREQKADIADELADIRTQMLNLLWKAQEALEGTGMTYERAEAYWIYHIKDALGDDGNRYTINIQSTIDDLLDTEEEEDN